MRIGQAMAPLSVVCLIRPACANAQADASNAASLQIITEPT